MRCGAASRWASRSRSASCWRAARAASSAACPAPTCPSPCSSPRSALCLLPAALLPACSSRGWRGASSATGRGSRRRAPTRSRAPAGSRAGCSRRALPALGRAELGRWRCCAPARRCADGAGSADRRWSRIVAAAGVAVALALLVVSPALDRAMTRWNHPDLLATRDTPYGRVTVTGALGQVAVFENDALAYESQGTAAEEFVQLAAVAARHGAARAGAGRRGAGTGAAGCCGSARRDGGRRRAGPRAARAGRARTCRRPQRARAGRPARARRRSPTRAASSRAPGRYDLILLGPARARLGAHEPLLHARVLRRLRRAARARRRARAAPARRREPVDAGADPARRRRPPRAARGLPRRRRAARRDEPAARLARAARRWTRPCWPRGCAARAARRAPRHPGLRALPLHERPLRRDRAARWSATPARANRDARPVCYQATMVLWLSRYFPRAGRARPAGARAPPTSRARPWPGPAARGAAGRASRWRGGAPCCGARSTPAVAGFAGMLLESVLLLALPDALAACSTRTSACCSRRSWAGSRWAPGALERLGGARAGRLVPARPRRAGRGGRAARRATRPRAASWPSALLLAARRRAGRRGVRRRRAARRARRRRASPARSTPPTSPAAASARSSPACCSIPMLGLPATAALAAAAALAALVLA